MINASRFKRDGKQLDDKSIEIGNGQPKTANGDRVRLLINTFNEIFLVHRWSELPLRIGYGSTLTTHILAALTDFECSITASSLIVHI